MVSKTRDELEAVRRLETGDQAAYQRRRGRDKRAISDRQATTWVGSYLLCDHRGYVESNDGHKGSGVGGRP